MTHNMAIDDHGAVRSFDYPFLSPRAAAIVKRVTRAHTQWLDTAKWAAKTIGRGTPLAVYESLAVAAYNELRRSMSWPVWSVQMTDLEVNERVFTIHTTYARVRRLVPCAFDTLDDDTAVSDVVHTQLEV